MAGMQSTGKDPTEGLDWMVAMEANAMVRAFA